ncbi:hypothetical protein [Synechococcus phage S-B68]|nr:hypothetical protein [Synechococcus phage S-B68]
MALVDYSETLFTRRGSFVIMVVSYILNMDREEAIKKFEERFKELGLNWRVVRVYLADLIEELQDNG